MKNHFILFTCCMGLLVSISCKRQYEPPELKVEYNYLVVDGVMANNVDSPTTFAISRTRKLSDTVLNYPERNANVSIEGSNGENFQLSELSPGNYSISHLTLNTSSTYRLNIVTSSGTQYQSDFVEVNQTPPIDSVNYLRPDDVTVYVNTHDPTNATKYYRWEYVETIQYESQNLSEIGVDNGLMYFRDSTNQIFNCWHIVPSTDIFIGSTTALTEDIISQFPLITIPKNSEKLGIRYSVLVKQYALTQAAYLYFQILKKNTEQQGSIFDVQPSQLKGNIHSVNNPDEPVIGYVTACNVSQQRLYIKNVDLPGWPRPVLTGLCDAIQLPTNPGNYLIYTYPDPRYVPWYFTGMGTILVVTQETCVDCRRQGGTNQKPSYW